MSKVKERVIKITHDNRFHAMGLVVDTFDEAVERCGAKGTGGYFLVWPPEPFTDDLDGTFEVCGTPKYLKQFLA